MAQTVVGDLMLPVTAAPANSNIVKVVALVGALVFRLMADWMASVSASLAVVVAEEEVKMAAGMGSGMGGLWLDVAAGMGSASWAHRGAWGLLVRFRPCGPVGTSPHLPHRSARPQGSPGQGTVASPS
mmetsp:Transcript_183427/g.446549  ORF Transcript_183427/g.446549 Transcript_183427/m.446549 type:complete len:128 (-) Transcript_183427:157-540(-)